MIVKPSWDKVQLYFTGDEYFRDVLATIASAKSEVLVESYIFDMDPIGLRVLAALKDAHLRGVKVRLLVDGIGSFNWLASLESYCKQNAIAFRAYHPLPFRSLILKKFSWRNLRRFLLLLRKSNKRNHRKIFLIDGKIAFLGSLNISQVHTKEFFGKKAWRDTGVQVRGQALRELKSAFTQAWLTARLGRTFLAGTIIKLRSRQLISSPLRLNSSATWRYKLLRDLNKKLKYATTRIYITNAYFIPRRSILRSLRKAASRGVYVGLCLPSHNDVWVVRWASKSLYYRLLKSGVRIFEYQPSMMHAKTLIIDQWATVGSHNLNHRSLVHDLEAEVVLSDQDSLHQLVHQWHSDIQNSQEITLHSLGKMNLLERALARFTYWFRYWI